MKILATSDLHGSLPEIPPCDLLLLGGDICPDEDQERWVVGQFRDWIRSLPAEKILMIAGNHDFFFQSKGWRERLAPHFLSYDCHYLEDSGLEIAGQKIWGSPWVEEMPEGWAFNLSSEDTLKRFSLIPEDTDILLTHSPPSGVLDYAYQQNLGSKALASRLQTVSPSLSLFGHIHECGGQEKKIGDTLFRNISLVDEKLRPAREPAEIKL